MISDAVLEFAKSVGAPIFAVFVTYLGLRQSGRKTKTDAAQNLFNEVQEERAELKKERSELKAEVLELRRELEAVKEADRKRDARDHFRDEFIQDLRNHIRMEKGPPPPDWPEVLRNG